MPSPTYLRLSEKKRNSFEKAAIAEFSNQGYHQASISNLVRTLGIAKGSVYQYFENKYALFEYLVNNAQSKLLEVIDYVDQKADTELSKWFVHRTMSEIKFARQMGREFDLIIHLQRNPVPEVEQLRDDVIKKDKALIIRAIKARVSGHENIDPIVFAITAIRDSFINENKNAEKTDQRLLDELYIIATWLFEKK